VTRREAPRSVRSRVVHELHRTPRPARRLPQRTANDSSREVVGHPRRVREQLARRGPREGIEGAPALQQLCGSCAASGSSSAKRPSLASLTATERSHSWSTLAARNASSARSARLSPRASWTADPAQSRPARAPRCVPPPPGAPAVTCASTAAWRRADTAGSLNERLTSLWVLHRPRESQYHYWRTRDRGFADQQGTSFDVLPRLRYARLGGPDDDRARRWFSSFAAASAAPLETPQSTRKGEAPRASAEPGRCA